MSLLYSNSWNYQDEEFRKNQHQLQSYRSAPTSFFDNTRDSSPETDALMATYLGEYGDRSEIKQELEMPYRSLPVESYEVAGELNNPLNAASTGPESHISPHRKYTSFDSWMDSSSSQFTRLRNNDDISFSTSNILENQNIYEDGNRRIGLTHHHSLPKTAAEMAEIEKLMKFEGSPCKIRAKRGFATHPRSIAERVRRTRISERMRKLHDLFPNLDKQTSTADMLDRAVEYIKELEKQVKSLSETKSNCKCSTP